MARRKHDTDGEDDFIKREIASTSVGGHLATHQHQMMIDDLVHHFKKLRVDTPLITELPQEIILEIVQNLDPSRNRRDLLNLSRTSRQFRAAATTILYRSANLATADSVDYFMATLIQCPDLVPLVKEISCPRLDGIEPRLPYAFWDSSNLMRNITLTLRQEGWRYVGESCVSCPVLIGHELLKRILERLPHLKALTIPQSQILGGPYTKELCLQHLTTLRISLLIQPETGFKEFTQTYCLRIVSWLAPRFIGSRFPSLERLEVLTHNGRWVAKLVPGDGNSTNGRDPERYVQSLVTMRNNGRGPAEWDLASLHQPIFHPSKFHTLFFAGPGCLMSRAHRCGFAVTQEWNLNTFLATTGRGLRTITLDWEWPYRGEYFEEQGCHTHLHTLTHLTCLTISLQLLFGDRNNFNEWVAVLCASPAKELARVFPESLKVLRINEVISGIFRLDSFDDDFNDLEDDRVKEHNTTVYSFLRILRDHWLVGDEDRQLWFKRFDGIDRHQRMDTDFRRGGLAYLVGHRVEGDAGKNFMPVERRQCTEGNDEEMTGVYQGGQLVLV